MLNIDDALRLYSMLKDFLPDPKEYSDSLKFAGKIIHNIKDSDTPEIFGESFLLMFPEVTLEDLPKMSGSEAVSLFIEGLSDNKILSLVEFCRSIGYG